MKILRLQAENFKRLRAVEIAPDGDLVQITGANASGKSSVLDAIFVALAGGKELPSQPIRQGEQSARVRLDLGELVVTRRFTPKGSTLTVESADGARFPSPQRMLDDLVGSISFDPLAFSRMPSPQQLETLRSLVPLDVDVDELDAANARDYEARRDLHREAKSLRAQAEAIAVPEGAPADPVDVSALLKEMEQAGQHNAAIEKRKANRAEVQRQADAADADAKRLRNEAASLRARIEELESHAGAKEQEAIAARERLAAAPALPKPRDVAAIRAQVEAAQRVNSAAAEVKRRLELEAAAESTEANAEKLTAAIEDRKRQKGEAIARARMPVDGLGFGDGEITFNGIPFAQASSAEQLRVSVAIAMAANPKLRVLRIKDGSLLDGNGLKAIAEMAAASDYQVWIEQVDTSGRVGFVMEDGAVANQPRAGQDREQPEAAT